ncbi:MAG: hypothetical protein ACRDMX_03045 [Solirubrobacteraceae bacterium]
MRGRAGLLAAAACTVALLCTATALAGTLATGNPQALVFARQVQRAYSKISVETISQTGYVAINDGEGRASFFNWAWGSGTVPRGWVRVREHEVVALHRGRIAWVRDDLTPPACRAQLCSELPVDVVLNRAGAFFAFGTATHHTCYGTLRGDTPETVGGPWYTVRGAFRPLRGHGALRQLGYTYSWGRQTAHETDTVSATTKLNEAGIVRVSGGGKAPLTVRFSTGHPARAPHAPNVNLCRA